MIPSSRDPISWLLLRGKSWIRVISVLLLVAPFLVAVWAFGIEPGMLVVRHRRMELPGWKSELRIAVLSDLHVGSPHVRLDKVRTIFPAQEGSFVVGPIALLGWGSQAGFVVAKVGIILTLPDPKLILLGAVLIGVPSADFDGPPTPTHLRLAKRARLMPRPLDRALCERAT